MSTSFRVGVSIETEWVMDGTAAHQVGRVMRTDEARWISFGT